MIKTKYRYLDETPGIDTGGASADPATADPAPAPAATGESVLNAAAPDPVAIPEKYQVKREDGSIDIDATSLKLAEGYAHLEKRIGTGDLPPKSVDEYQIAVPEELQPYLDPANDPLLSEFKAEALAAGMTQAQMDFVMGKYFGIVPQLLNGNNELSVEQCTADLRADWKTDEQFNAEVGKAFKAANAYGGSDAESLIKDYGNDPRIVRMLARIGGELGEDAPIGNVAPQGTGGGVESLMQSEAYRDPKHPEHKAVSLKVQQHFEKRAAAAERAGNGMLL